MENQNSTRRNPTAPFMPAAVIAVIFAATVACAPTRTKGSAPGTTRPVEMRFAEADATPMELKALAFDRVSGDFTNACGLNRSNLVTVMFADDDYVLARYRAIAASGLADECHDGADLVMKRAVYDRFGPSLKESDVEQGRHTHGRDFRRKQSPRK